MPPKFHKRFPVSKVKLHSENNRNFFHVKLKEKKKPTRRSRTLLLAPCSMPKLCALCSSLTTLLSSTSKIGSASTHGMTQWRSVPGLWRGRLVEAEVSSFCSAPAPLRLGRQKDRKERRVFARASQASCSAMPCDATWTRRRRLRNLTNNFQIDISI